MNLCFFGTRSAIDYHQIGGTENFVRRIACRVTERGAADVDYVMYDAEETRRETLDEGITLRYFERFDEALSEVLTGYDHVTTTYLKPSDRPKYHAQRRLNGDGRHGFVFFSWPDSRLKRLLYFNEARVFPYDGPLFCISRRQQARINRLSTQAKLLYPPVPESYFRTGAENDVGERIRVRFVGRVDPEKGINEVIELFNSLDSNRFECHLHGIHIADDPEAERIHRWLAAQSDIRYHHQERQSFSPEVEAEVGETLSATDVFVQPYRDLSSTIDTPLLLLEAMAARCPVVTVAHRNVRETYGESQFLRSPDSSAGDLVEFMSDIDEEDVRAERERLDRVVRDVDFSTGDTTDAFLSALRN